MSQVNIKGLVNNIKAKTNVYTPLVEAVVNSIQAIDSSNIEDGEISIRIIRDNQKPLQFDEDALSEIVSIEVHDNGAGFTQENRTSFDTVYSDHKSEQGGKGFGRFTFLKYFNEVSVESIYLEKGKKFKRSFSFGKDRQIVEEENIEKLQGNIKNKTILYLRSAKVKNRLDKKLETVARKLLEKLLIFFINDSYKCPKILVREDATGEEIILNDCISDEKNGEIQEIVNQEFELVNDKIKESFKVKIFKIFYTRTQSSISLTAHNREVVETPLHHYIPEFIDDFYEEIDAQNGERVNKNYTIKTYVLGKYLDNNVSLERGDFEFSSNVDDLLFPFSQQSIEKKASEITSDVFSNEVKTRQTKKIKKINEYVTASAPWNRPYLEGLDYSIIPYKLNDEMIELELQKQKFNKEQKVKKEIKEILDSGVDKEIPETLQKIVREITEAQKSDLTHYVCNRKLVLELFKKLLEREDDGTVKYEKDIHNVIFPMGKDSLATDYEEHNLWLLDERLVFSQYIASDKKISNKVAPTEPDLVVFDAKRSFRSGDNEFSNALTIFEFKRPKRESYRQEDDPILQVGNYLEEIRSGKYETPKGVEKVKVNEYTPVYSYIICDITDRIRDFAKQNQLTPSPDLEGYFGFHSGFKMYVEIISFKKLLKDANLRNKIFFKKLGIE